MTEARPELPAGINPLDTRDRYRPSLGRPTELQAVSAAALRTIHHKND